MNSVVVHTTRPQMTSTKRLCLVTPRPSMRRIIVGLKVARLRRAAALHRDPDSGPPTRCRTRTRPNNKETTRGSQPLRGTATQLMESKMNTMNMPRFTAENSVYATRERYCTAVFDSLDTSANVQPAMSIRECRSILRESMDAFGRGDRGMASFLVGFWRGAGCGDSFEPLR
jgi:hypothetical protein